MWCINLSNVREWQTAYGERLSIYQDEYKSLLKSIRLTDDCPEKIKEYYAGEYVGRYSKLLLGKQKIETERTVEIGD